MLNETIIPVGNDNLELTQLIAEVCRHGNNTEKKSDGKKHKHHKLQTDSWLNFDLSYSCAQFSCAMRDYHRHFRCHFGCHPQINGIRHFDLTCLQLVSSYVSCPVTFIVTMAILQCSQFPVIIIINRNENDGQNY